MTALTPPKGAEGDLNKYRESSAFESGWISPLPGGVPLELYSLSFPRDRVNPAGLKELPSLNLEGPVSLKGQMILELKNPAPFHDSSRLFREIHGKKIPKAEEISFINWHGLLLSPSGSSHGSIPGHKTPEEKTGIVSFHYRTWQLGLYKIRYDEKRLWWENFSWSCLWTVRKPSA